MKTASLVSLAGLLAVAICGCASTSGDRRTQGSQTVLQMSALMGGELQGMRHELSALRASMDTMNARLDALGAPQVREQPAPPTTDLQQSAPPPQPTETGIPQTITFGPPAPEPGAEMVPVPPLDILSEFGRDLEAAATLQRSSLKGMVCVVPRNTPRAALERLGRDLRMQFDAYDNINIDVFDDAEAAESYAKQPSANAAHRVLQITKYRDTGQDAVLVFRDGKAVPVF